MEINNEALRREAHAHNIGIANSGADHWNNQQR